MQVRQECYQIHSQKKKELGYFAFLRHVGVAYLK